MMFRLSIFSFLLISFVQLAGMENPAGFKVLEIQKTDKKDGTEKAVLLNKVEVLKKMKYWYLCAGSCIGMGFGTLATLVTWLIMKNQVNDYQDQLALMNGLFDCCDTYFNCSSRCQ